MREPTFEIDGTRWTWVVYGSPLLSGNFSIQDASAISFPGREAAEHNYRLHSCSKSDAYGRRLLTETELNRLLGYAAQICAECAFDGRVVRAPADADGLNWAIYWNGMSRRGKNLMYGTVMRLRKTYNLLDK